MNEEVEQNSRWREHLMPLAFICAGALLFFTPRFFGNTYSSVGQHMLATYPWTSVTAPNKSVPNRGYAQTDHAETYYPLSVFATEAWRDGELPMWLPYSFGGVPVMELGMTSLLYPPRILLLLLFNPIRQHDLMMFLHLLVAGLGMYALLRCWGANAQGAVAGAFVWQFNGHNAFWLVIEQMAMVAAWLPLILCAATLAVRRRSFKWAVATGAGLGVALYSGGAHYVHLSGWLLAVWYGIDVLYAALGAFRGRQTRAAIAYLLLPVTSLLTAALVGFAYWLPLLRAMSDVSRSPLTLEAQANQAFSWPGLMQGLSLPRSASSVAGAPDFASFAFTGLMALALAVTALFFSRSKHVRIAFVFAVMALLTALGVQWWLKLLHPFFGAMNLHAAFYVFDFAIAALAGFGLSELGRLWANSKRKEAILLPAVIVAIAGVTQTVLLRRAFGQVFDFSLSQLWDCLLSARGLILLASIASLFGVARLLTISKQTILGKTYKPRRTEEREDKNAKRRRWLPALGYLTAVVMALDLLLFAWMTIPYHPAHPDWFFPETPLVTNLKRLQQERRILPVYHHADFWTPPVFAGKTAAIFGLCAGHGYESLLPSRVALLWRTVENGGNAASTNDLPLAYRPAYFHERLPIGLLEKLSVGLFVTPPRVEPLDAQSGRNLVADGALRVIYQGADGWIYEDPKALKRAFIVPQVTQVADELQALKILTNPDFDARKAALIEQPLTSLEAELTGAGSGSGSVPAESESSARITRERLNEVEIETSSAQAGILVLNDSWAAGWRSTVDGAPQTVRRVNFSFRGVVIPAGNHRVVFRYRPPLLLLSIVISALSLLASAFWLAAGPARELYKNRPQVLKVPRFLARGILDKSAAGAPTRRLAKINDLIDDVERPDCAGTRPPNQRSERNDGAIAKGSESPLP
ncbi:MAG TPA: YfhO family protein [Blastocatellia bacterium]|nr:YfhO family protein [Blastocatellia bacterium]